MSRHKDFLYGHRLATPSLGLVFLRVFVGWVLFRAGLDKLTHPELRGVVAFAAPQIENAPAWTRFWFENVVQAWPALFDGLVRWGELLAGAALLTGTLVRPAAAGAVLLLLNFWFVGPPEASGYVLLLAAVTVVLGVERTGDLFGLDAQLGGKLPSWLTWVG